MSDGTLGGGPNDSLFREYVASLPEEPWDPQDPTSRLCKRTEDEVVAIAIGTAQRMAARKASRREKGRKRVKKAPTRVVPPQPTPEPEPEATAETAPDRPDLKALSVNDLRTAYLEEVGRATKSTDRNYLMWKIRQARKGKVPVGPVSRTHSEAGTLRVLPLRMPNDTVEALDDVWHRHGLSSRMDMFRCALHQYLTSLEEHEAAALIHR